MKKIYAKNIGIVTHDFCNYYLEIIIIFSPTPLSGILTLQTPVPLSQLHTTVSVSFSRFSYKRSGLVFFIFFPLTVTSFGAFAE